MNFKKRVYLCAREKDFQMKLKETWAYYRELRFHNLTTKKYKHLLLLLYWPIYGLCFFTLEKAWPDIWKSITGETLVYNEVYCSFDAYIPFCEWFAIPYYFWFAFLIGMILFGLLFDIQAFRQFSWFIMVTYTATIVIYLLWPNMQALRPTEFARDNWLVDCVKGLYEFDTNTNVCPSIHVLGSFATCFAGLHSKKLRGWGWKTFFIATTVLISLSTVFLRQHSVLDVLFALILCAIAYPIVFRWICRPREDDATIA